MFSSETDRFLKDVLNYIKSPFDREEIKSDLEDQILEKIKHYAKQGYDKETAEKLSIKDMGDPKELGIKLNKEYNLFISLFLKITNAIIALLLIWNIYIIGATLVMTLFSGNLVNEIPKSDIAYRMDIDERVKLDDTVIHFTNIVYEKDGDINIFYKYYDTKLWGTGWSLGSIGKITDNLGNTYFTGSGHGSGGIVSKGRRTLENFSNEADTLIISYDYYNRKYRVEIPLKVGEINE